MQIRHGAIRAGFIDPFGRRLQDLGAGFSRRDGGGEEFPVGFGVQVARVEGETVALEDEVVPVGLLCVDVAGHKAGCCIRV